MSPGTELSEFSHPASAITSRAVFGGRLPFRGVDRASSEADRYATRSEQAFERAEDTPDPGARAARLAEAQRYAAASELAAAYTYLQRAVGLIAVSLPFVVSIGHAVTGGELQGSISAYYYTHMGNVFVGSLCALAVFFLSYNYRPLPGFHLDRVLSSIASVAAVGVALFPTISDPRREATGERVVSFIHLLCAGVLFLMLATFSLVMFTRSSGPMTAQKRRRNGVYRVCGWIIVAVILAVIVTNAVEPPSSWHALFWLETTGVVAFGVSWLVKGGLVPFLNDA